MDVVDVCVALPMMRVIVHGMLIVYKVVEAIAVVSEGAELGLERVFRVLVFVSPYLNFQPR